MKRDAKDKNEEDVALFQQCSNLIKIVQSRRLLY